MNWTHLIAQIQVELPLAQELPVPPEYKGYVITAVIALLAGATPHVIQLLKARSELKKEDRDLTIKERDKLMGDLRLERDLLRTEFKTDKQEWKKEIEILVTRHHSEMNSLRKEHEDCLKTTAAQEQAIKELTKDVTELQNKSKELQAKLEAIPKSGEPHV